MFLVHILIRAPEPCGACKNKGRTCFSNSLWTEPLVCVVTWTCSSVFMEDFSENLLQGLPGGHSDPRSTRCGSALPHPSESPFGHVHPLPTLKRNGGPAYLSTNLHPVLSNREEKKTLLSSVNCFFVTGTLQRHFSLKCILAEKNPYYRF